MSISLKDLVEDLIKRLVDESDQVEVLESEGDKTVIYEVRVAKEDMGKVIGRKGKTIESLRTIVAACGAKQKKRCLFQIIDEDE